MVFMTHTEPDTPNYDEVLRTRWSHYFYVMACAPLLSFLVLVGAFALKPSEWKLHPSLEKNVYIQNPAANIQDESNGSKEMAAKKHNLSIEADENNNV